MEIAKNVHAFIWRSTSANNCNTYLIDGPTRVLIDPGHTRLFGHVREEFSQLGITIEDIDLIITTHAHLDHIEGVEIFKKTNSLTTLHEDAWQFINRMGKPVARGFGGASESEGPDFFLKEGDLSVTGLSFRVLHTPGHSPGSICLYLSEQKLLFTGDLIFRGGIGRTDIPGGIGAQLKESIIRVSELDIEGVLPGHGDPVNGKTEVKTNFDHIRQHWFNYL
jgi:glyoxylase-like metal-dependent hydrolase (beta-lactamase superfamily II)